MKKVLTILLVLASMGTACAQQVSSRAKAMRMMTYAKPEYLVKDIKVIADTMIVYSLGDFVIYPFGKWETVEHFITNNQLQWYREVGYKFFYDSMNVSVNTMKRLDGSYIDIYRSITTKMVEILAAKITDPEVVLDNGVHVGMTKEEVMSVVFKKYPKPYTSEINILKVISGAGEVSEIYTFKGNRLRHVQVVSKYKYY